jgi:hypothetical protein
MPLPEIVLMPNPVMTVENVFVPVVLTREQAEEAFRNSFAPMVLCVDVPRALYVRSVAEAFRFYDHAE